MTASYARARGVVWRRTFDRVLLRRPAGGDVVVVGASGPALWDVLAQPRSLTEAAALLAADHGVDTATVEADIAPVLDRLVELSVVVVEDEQAGS